MKIIKKTLQVLLLLNVLNTYGQTDIKFILNYDKGYFIQNDEEKIECYIYDSEFKIIDFHPNKIKYKLSPDDKAKFINFKDVKEFKRSYEVYERLTYNGRDFFLKREIKGEISLYSRIVKHNNTMMTPQGTTFSGSTEKTEYFLKINEKVQRVPKLGFIEFILDYVKDNEKISTEIRNKKLRYNDLYIIVSRYNMNH